MMQSEFLRDVDRYLDRRFAEHVPAGIRHRSEPMVLGLDQTKMRPEVSQNNDGAWSFRAALWAQSAPEELTNTNEDRWTLSPYDRRRETWTLDNMRDAVVLGAVLGCKIVPPRVGAPAGKRRWSLMVTVDLPDPELPAEERPYTAGVDIGIKHFAVYSCPERPTFDFISSRELQADMERVRREKRGVPRKRRQAVGAKLGRRQDTFCRLVARRLIDNCVRDRVGLLRVESLAGIREAACDDADRNFMLGARFPYFKLQTYLSQAAEKAGVAIQYIDPAGTSQTCSKCGHRDPESRKSKRFVCTKCGFQADADLNAANNIARSRKATPSRKTRGNTSPAGSIPSDAPDCTGEALEAQVVGAEVQPNALWPVGCRVEVNPFAGE
jgi:transposase